MSTATLTILLAGAKTSAGNLDRADDKPWANLPLSVTVNGHALESWVIPSEKSSSCAVRSQAACYALGRKWVFGSGVLGAGRNEVVLALPVNGTAGESAVLPESVYVQYDALRLEVE